jgi:hypothetical protein
MAAQYTADHKTLALIAQGDATAAVAATLVASET